MKNANPVSRGGRVAAVLGLVLAAAGCGAGKPAAGAPAKSVFDHFTVSVGGSPASLQFAILPAEQERGLMQRPDLGRDEGMVFVSPGPRQQSFWMRNTPEALDVGFLTPDGTIAEIYPLLPLDERTVLSHSHQLQFALEMPAGWFAAHGVHPGSRIDLPAVIAAVKARGFDPVKFHLEEPAAP